jgi:hypothetical protein
MSKRIREWRLSRARAARAEKPAAPPDPTEEFAKKAAIGLTLRDQGRDYLSGVTAFRNLS